MITSGKKAMLPSERSKVWKVVTSVEHYTWRSDLRGTEILCENQFLEYPKRGPVTAFTITTVEPCNRWEFDMENTNMRGHWTGLFTQTEEGTEMEFTETVEVKKRFLKLFVKGYLKRHQTRFVSESIGKGIAVLACFISGKGAIWTKK